MEIPIILVIFMVSLKRTNNNTYPRRLFRGFRWGCLPSPLRLISTVLGTVLEDDFLKNPMGYTTKKLCETHQLVVCKNWIPSKTHLNCWLLERLGRLGTQKLVMCVSFSFWGAFSGSMRIFGLVCWIYSPACNHGKQRFSLGFPNKDVMSSWWWLLLGGE